MSSENETLFALKEKNTGLVWWLMPVNPVLWEAQAGKQLRSGVQDQPDQYGETPSLLKMQKLAGCDSRHP